MMYEELIKSLRFVANNRATTTPELLIDAADAIEDLEYALLLMVLQYCTTDDGLLFHEFMSAGENAFAVLGLENGQQEAPLWYKMDRMMQSASERISAKTAPKEETCFVIVEAEDECEALDKADNDEEIYEEWIWEAPVEVEE